MLESLSKNIGYGTPNKILDTIGTYSDTEELFFVKDNYGKYFGVVQNMGVDFNWYFEENENLFIEFFNKTIIHELASTSGFFRTYIEYDNEKDKASYKTTRDFVLKLGFNPVEKNKFPNTYIWKKK